MCSSDLIFFRFVSVEFSTFFAFLQEATVEYEGTSLKEELLQSPQLNNSLISVLLQFKKENVAIASDIESMFHRVACRDEDTDTISLPVVEWRQ